MVGNLPPATKCVSRACLLLALSLALFSACAWPQTQLATIFGTVTDATGAAISGAQVAILNQSTGLKRDAPTDSTGQYHIAGLPTGTYSVRVEKEGFQSQVREGIALTSASEIMMNLSLSVGDLKQQVTVSADVPTIDNTTSTVSGLLPEQSLTELPLNGRDLFKAAILEPGVAPTPSSAPSLLSTGKAGQVSINGMRPSWTNVLIDGMDANDPVFGYSPAGASGLFLGLNELAEVRVLTQTFNAEYGKNAGGVIEAVTKSGSNQFHGSLFELHRDAALDAKNYFDLGNAPIPAFVRNQFGAGIGGPLAHDRTFFFANYEGFREVQASTAIATVPDALAHQGLLPSSSNPGSCSNADPSGCVAITIDPRIQQFLALLRPANGADNGDGTGDLITANKGDTNEHHGMIRVDHNFSNTHSLFGRYIIDDSSSLVPYFGTPPGTYVPGFPVAHDARNQYFTVQDRRNIGRELFNELRFGINRTTASTSTIDTHPGLSISLIQNRPFGMLNIAGMSLIGNSPEMPLGDFSTIYQVQDQVSRSRGRHSLKFGGEYRRIQSNGPLDFVVNGLYTFQDLSPFGFQASSNNPALEFFLQALPLSYVASVPSMSDSHRGYRQSVVSGFAQDFLRVTSRLTVNAGLRYDFYSNPTEAHGRLSIIRNPAMDSGPTVGKVFAATPRDLLSPQTGFAWNIFGDGKTVLRGGAGIFRDQLPVVLFGADRFLSPFFGIDSFVFPNFLNPQNALLTQPIYIIETTYHPKFPYALQYNLNLEREIAPGTILSAGYFGARGNHLTREAEQNPFEPAVGHRYNPNLLSPLLTVLTDAQSFYNSFQLSVSNQHAHNVSWQVFYTLSHSIDDASTSLIIEAVNEPPASQNIFDRKGSRGRSSFDIRHNFVANVVYELPFGRGSRFGGWQISAVASVHSNVPFTPVLSFDNADLQSLLTSERPNLVGNPYTGVCGNGSRVGTPSCWFNPSAFALPPPGQFGTAGRNILRGPAFAQFDLALQKGFQLKEGRKLTFGAEAYNLFNHPNFAVPSNTQSPLTLGGNGDAVFKDAAGNLANNVGRIFTTVGTGRQIQFDARFTF
jgi:Carboxypeptidase regulatory-like domain/TonB-dependent Receptor Plug Domain/TonB dependent receptor